MTKKTINKKSKAYKRKRRRRTLFIFEIIVLLILAFGLAAYAYVNEKMNKIQNEELDFEKVKVNEEVIQGETLKGTQLIALVGLDSRDGSIKQGNSDTMMVACIDNDTKVVKLVSIYRDTYLKVGEKKYGKANSAYAIGGAEQMLSMMNQNLDLNISEYVTVDFKALAVVIDLLGGLDITMTRDELINMNDYNKETSKVAGVEYEKIPVPDIGPQDKQTYHLKGTQAVSYARIRYGGGNDFRRASRQRVVVAKIVEKAKGASLSTLNRIMDEVFPLISTSLTKGEILKMGMNMLTYELGEQTGFPFAHLEGENVKKRMNGKDVVLPVTLEYNVIKLHDFLAPGVAYTPSANVHSFSEKIIEESGYSEDNIPQESEDGAIP